MNNEYVFLDKKRKLIGWLLFFPFYLYGARIVILPIVSKFKFSESTTSMIAMIIRMCVCFAFSIIFFKCFLVESYNNYKTIDKKDRRRVLLKYFGFMVVCNVIATITRICLMRGLIKSSVNQNNIKELVSNNPIATFIMMVFLAPLVEEVIFRGVIFTSLVKRNKLIAIITTTILFAGIHVIKTISISSAIDALYDFVGYLGLSFAITYTYYKTKNITFCIVLHFIQNLLSASLMLLNIFTK